MEKGIYTIDDIAGYKEEKKELKKIIDMINNYDKYKAKGVYLSKGLILSGKPGVGKTLFARVLASLINAPLITIDGTDSDNELCVAKIQAAFKKAKEKSPSMIFIDELDSLVGDYSYETDYTRKNLSCLLKEIDIIKQSNDIFVVGATTKKDEIDSALISSGRMDKHICISLPDNQSRREIFKKYLNTLSLDISKVNIRQIVEESDNLSGADIKAAVNEAAITTISNHESQLNTHCIINAINEIKNKNRIKTVNKELIYHDLGHLIVSHVLINYFDTIFGTGNIYDGNDSIVYLKNTKELNEFLTKNYEYNYDEDYIDCIDEYEEEFKREKYTTDYKEPINSNNALNIVAIYLAGLAIEKIKGSISTNNFKDIDYATSAIYMMMNSGFFGLEYAAFHCLDKKRPFVSAKAEKIEAKKDELLNDALNLATKIIESNMHTIDLLYKKFSEKNILMRKDALTILSKKIIK